MESKKNEDPIIRTKQYILDHDLADAEALDAIDEEVKAEVMDAVEFAEQSPLPRGRNHVRRRLRPGRLPLYQLNV